MLNDFIGVKTKLNAMRFSTLVIALCLLYGCSAPREANRIDNSPTTASKQSPSPSSQTLTRNAVIAARKKYRVSVVSFDASQEYGTEFPYSDFVRLRITNGADVTLRSLTVLTKRFDGDGKMIGSSRAPSISVRDLMPGETVEVDYYPRGHLFGVKKITVEIEALIPPDAEQFFDELTGTAAG